MRQLLIVLLLFALAACGGTPTAPTPTDAPPASTQPTPTFESGNETPTGAASLSVKVSGAITSEFTEALLTAEAGKDFTFLLEQQVSDNPLQLRLILAANIGPGTYPIVGAQDFQLPEDATVAAHFDLGFPASDISGQLVLESIADDKFTGSLDLTAKDGDQTITVAGRFENITAKMIG